MDKEKHKVLLLPTVAQFEEELKRVKYQQRYRMTLRSTVFSLITVAAMAILVATIFLPVLQIYGSSMTPTMDEGDIIVSVKQTDFETKDVIAFYFNNKILVKRVIARSGQWVDMDEEGNVYVNGKILDEPYVTEKAVGECDISFPYQVPEGRIFVMGDYRSVSIDSRNTTVGCIAEEQIVGKLVYRVWPLNRFGKVA